MKAYAYVIRPIWTPILRDGTFNAKVSVRNGGATPAYDVEMSAYVALLPSQLSKPITGYEPPEPVSTMSEAFLFKDSELNISVDLVDAIAGGFSPHHFTEDDLIELGADITRVYVWGGVTYVDAFHEPRYLHFCYFFHPSDTSEWHYCDQDNDADEYEEE